MSAWPSTLPAPLGSDYGVDFTDATVRTDMESGPARVRRRYTAAPDMVQLGWKFTEAQMATFRTFFEDTIAMGAAWFDLPLKDGRAAGMVTREVRFTQPPRAAYIPGFGWHVSAVVEVRSA